MTCRNLLNISFLFRVKKKLHGFSLHEHKRVFFFFFLRDEHKRVVNSLIA